MHFNAKGIKPNSPSKSMLTIGNLKKQSDLCRHFHNFLANEALISPKLNILSHVLRS